MSDVKYPDVHVQLTGRDGNVFSIIGAVSAALKRAGHQVEAEEFASRAMDSASYEEVLALVQRTVEVS
jgi:menaquinone-dependent protoporphyrinogen IX oxidase